ncbi:MAG: protease inhibitor I42 family protein, partial [Pseudomonadota bacterium]
MIPKTHHFQLDHATKKAHIGNTDIISVELPESPTTGYRWQLAPHVKLPGLNLIDQQFKVNLAQNSGVRTFVFRPTGERTEAQLHFCLKRAADAYRNSLQEFGLD